MDEKTGAISRDGQQMTVNPYDLPALECALELKERYGGKVTVFTMGPNSAESVLRTAYAYGADEGVLVCDKAFAGADVLGTSYTLMQAIRAKGAFDVILCGERTTDGDTAQVGRELAEWMDIPVVTGVIQVKEVAETMLYVQRRAENCIQSLRTETPAVLVITHDGFPVRMPTLAKKLQAGKKSIFSLGLSDLFDKNAEHYGFKGSATKVTRIYPAESEQRDVTMIYDAKRGAEVIRHVLEERR